MKKIIILSVSLLTVMSLFAAKNNTNQIAKKATKVTFENITASYKKVTNMDQKFLLNKCNQLTKMALADYKTKGSNYINVRIKAVLLNAYIKDQQFFEFSTKLNKKWAANFANKSLQLSRLGQQIFIANSQKKLATDEGKKIVAQYKIIAKQMIALSKKPVKANKTEYLRQQKAYSQIMKKKATDARARARSRKIRSK